MNLTDNLVFRIPDERDILAISAYRQAIISANENFCGCARLNELSDPREWLADNAKMASLQTLPAGFVLATQFILLDEQRKKILGMLSLRHNLNDFLLNYAGHIGYSVAPDERRKGYAKFMLQNAFEYCAKLGLSKVLITCATTNVASRKTILACGGEYEDSRTNPKDSITHERYWFNLE